MPRKAGYVGSDRRMVGRRVTRLKVPCRVLRATVEGPWPATVRNVSDKGIGFIAERHFLPGTILALELASKTKEPEVLKLVRVTHVEQSGKQWWSMGGVFAKNLSSTALHSLKIRSPSIIRRNERRTFIRHASRLKDPCRVLRATQEGPWLGSVRNISSKGLGLIIDSPFHQGMILTVEFPPLRLSKPQLMRVTFSKKQANSPWWVLGGVFLAPLGKGEVEALLVQPQLAGRQR